jgi:flagellar motility protein MotE (MotC chaperone)
VVLYRTLPLLTGVLLVAGGAFTVFAASGGGDDHGGGHDAAAPAGNPTEENVPSVKNERTYSAAELDILQSLEERRIALDRRAQALELREKLVDMLEERLAGRVSELNQLKADLEGIMKSASGEDEGKLKQLANVYGAMKPDAAAEVLNRVDNLLVHDILVRMPAKRAGKLMEALEPVKARRLSELMAQKTPLPVAQQPSSTEAP